MRDDIHAKIMKGLPNRNYIAEIHKVVQDTIIEFMPKEVRALHDNPELAGFLTENSLEVRRGNVSVPMWMTSNGKTGRYDYVLGLKVRLVIRMDDTERMREEGKATLYSTVVTRLADSGLVDGYFTQEDLRKDVARRLKANLASAGTIKRLYDVLEPELHGYIPKDTTSSTLPACVAPVVDDLRKLGAVLPETPKATEKK
jgi:hypothetical protein